jgi:hypothetical protein
MRRLLVVMAALVFVAALVFPGVKRAEAEPCQYGYRRVETSNEYPGFLAWLDVGIAPFRRDHRVYYVRCSHGGGAW